MAVSLFLFFALGIDVLGSAALDIDHPHLVGCCGNWTDPSSRYTAQWCVEGDIIEFQVTARTRGWVGIGFSNNRAMANSDVVIGAASSEGSSFLYDGFATRRSRPPMDSENNLMDSSVTRTGSEVTIFFSRKRVTGDRSDIALNSSVFFLYAWGGRVANFSEKIFSRHTFRSISETRIDLPSAVDCPASCILENGTFILNGETYEPDDPCVDHCVCSNGEFICAIITCSIPICGVGQEPLVLPGQCCPQCVNTSCILENGTSILNGEIYEPDDPCVDHCVCSNGEFICAIITCSIPICGVGQEPLVLPGQCCPQCVNTSCILENGTSILNGEIYEPDDPCVDHCVCSNGELICAIIACSIPICGVGQEPLVLPGQCCPQCVNTSCILENGTSILNGEIYEPDDPCVDHCVCSNGELICAEIFCAIPLCVPGYDIVTLPGNCCPSCVKTSCQLKNGSSILNGKRFEPNDPCVDHCVCSNGELVCAVISCVIPLCRPGYEIMTLPGNCCPSCVRAIKQCTHSLCSNTLDPTNTFCYIGGDFSESEVTVNIGLEDCVPPDCLPVTTCNACPYSGRTLGIPQRCTQRTFQCKGGLFKAQGCLRRFGSCVARRFKNTPARRKIEENFQCLQPLKRN